MLLSHCRTFDSLCKPPDSGMEKPHTWFCQCFHNHVIGVGIFFLLWWGFLFCLEITNTFLFPLPRHTTLTAMTRHCTTLPSSSVISHTRSVSMPKSLWNSRTRGGEGSSCKMSRYELVFNVLYVFDICFNFERGVRSLVRAYRDLPWREGCRRPER